MEIILAVEVPTRPTADSAADSGPDPSDGDENPAWGEQRIANEFLVKLGIQLSPRTVSKYLSRRPPGRPRGDLRWSTFLRLHAQGIIACDFLVTVTATFRLLYVFVVIEHRSRRLNSRHRRGESYAVRVNPILGGLHHEYFLAPAYT
jgi:hypothetical protein